MPNNNSIDQISVNATLNSKPLTIQEDVQAGLPGADLGAAPGSSDRGLSYSNKVSPKIIRILNRSTQEILNIDPFMSRLARMVKRVRAWSEALKDKECTIKMVTLTYRPGCVWKPNHIRQFMLDIREYLEDNLLAYAWVAELQDQRAAKYNVSSEQVVHYHVLLALREKEYIPKAEKFWHHGLTKVETARTSFYIVSYANKLQQKGATIPYPKNLRIFAVWLSKDFFVEAVRFVFRKSMLPRWLVDLMDSAGSTLFPARRAGGGWLLKDTGEIVESPYSFLCIRSGWELTG